MGQFHSFFTIGLIQQSSIPFPFNYLERWENSCKIALCFNVSPRVYFHLNHEAGIFPIRSSDCPGSVHERFRAGCEARRPGRQEFKTQCYFYSGRRYGLGRSGFQLEPAEAERADGGQEERVQDPGFVRAGPGGNSTAPALFRRSGLRSGARLPAAGGAPGEFPRGEEQPL